jgi:hypothetical protein
MALKGANLLLLRSRTAVRNLGDCAFDTVKLSQIRTAQHGKVPGRKREPVFLHRGVVGTHAPLYLSSVDVHTISPDELMLSASTSGGRAAASRSERSSPRGAAKPFDLHFLVRVRPVYLIFSMMPDIQLSVRVPVEPDVRICHRFNPAVLRMGPNRMAITDEVKVIERVVLFQ